MIFCDMDNVLVDFDNNYKKKYGVFPSEISLLKIWTTVLATKNYWLNLPMQNDAQELITYLSKFDFQILTGLPFLDFKRAKKEKTLWIQNNVGKHIKVICCLSKDKHTFCKPGDILIDDLKNNIQKWQNTGGIGILHTCAKQTIQELKSKGF